MVLPFALHRCLSPFVSCFLAKTGYIESKAELNFSALGIPMLIKAPSKSTYVHGLTGTGYNNPQMERSALLTPTNEYATAKFVGEINFVMLKTTAGYHLLQHNLRGMVSSVMNFMLRQSAQHLEHFQSTEIHFKQNEMGSSGLLRD